MNNLEKLNKLIEYHHSLKKLTNLDLTVLEYIINKLINEINTEQENIKISIEKALKYLSFPIINNETPRHHLYLETDGYSLKTNQ